MQIMKTRFTRQSSGILYTGGMLLNRRVVLIDIENIVGGGIVMGNQVHEAQRAITAVVGQRPGDQVILACGKFGAPVVGFEWEGSCRFVFRSGPDGADLELLEVLETEHIADRFAEVVLVSGDGIFAEEVSRLGAANVDVTVVSRPEACSRSLRMAASHTIYINGLPNAAQEIA